MRKRHKKKKTIPRHFFSTIEEWDEFLINMKPGTKATVKDGELIILSFGWKGVMRDV